MVGYANSGKSTISRNYQWKYGSSKIRGFSEPLYEILNIIGVDQKFIDDKLLREIPHPALGGKTPIDALISLGTDWGREMIHEDIWVNITERRINDGITFIENVRFQNEADIVRRHGGILVYIDNKELVPKLERKSEQYIATLKEQCEYTIDILPNTTEDETTEKMRAIINERYV